MSRSPSPAAAGPDDPHPAATGVANPAQKTGWALTGFATLFLGFDAITHLIREAHVVEANAELGGPEYFDWGSRQNQGPSPPFRPAAVGPWEGLGPVPALRLRRLELRSTGEVAERSGRV